MTELDTSVYEEIFAERMYQQEKWGNEADDEKNVPNDFVSYVSSYATKWFPGGFVPYKPDTVDAFRKSMVKVAAIAVAAIESIDRQRAANGRTFYEDA